MSVVGVDLGTQNTVIAVARNRGVDVITNEVSNRATPTLVGFGPKNRYLGEAAKTQEISNLKNTVGSLKRLAGRSFKDPDVAIEQEYVSAKLVDVHGQVGAEVNYLGAKETFTSTQLVAMFLSKVKQTASAELKTPAGVSDIVISVPAWFTDAQRRSVMDAAEIAGLKLLRLINDTTATALGYGITKLDLPSAEEPPRRVAFVDIGHSNYTVSIVAFRKGELTVLSTAYDRHLGGRDFDRVLIDHFAKEFKDKYKIDVKSNPKAMVRMAAAVEKLKKILSANASAPLNIESLMNDVDVSSIIKREDLEAMVKPVLDRATKPLQQALDDAKLTIDDIDVVEMVGGCTRVPSLKERIAAFFKKQLSFTLNQDEAVARGCAFACAILSPVFRVRDFSVHDINSHAIDFTWEKSADIPDEDTELTVFAKGNPIPSTKILTFYRKQPFDLEARYKTPEALPGKPDPWIGRFSVKGVKPPPDDDFVICKLKARLNLHGVLNVESGYYVGDVTVEEPIPQAELDKMKETAGDAEVPTTRTVTKSVKQGDLPLSTATASLDTTTIQAYSEKENQMIVEDKLVADTEQQKNALEEYIYDLRNKIDDLYSEFANEEEKTKIKNKLEQTEDWLYDEGEDTTKAVYIAKFDEIRFVAGPIVQRYLDKQETEREAQEKARAEADAKAKAEAEAAKKNKDEEMADPDVQPAVTDDPDVDMK